MLLITLREGDYFLIGDNVKVTFERGRQDAMCLGIDAPREVSVKRGKVYEEQIARMAEAGDANAARIQRELLEDYEKRAKKYNARRASRTENFRRIAAGEIKTPHGWGQSEEEAAERHNARVEADRKALAGE